jgi:toxin ParE1/3/4
LAGIDEYGADQFGQDAADAYSRGFNEVFALLRRHPLAGAPSPKLGKNIRCIVHRRHRIFYRLDGDAVLILRVIHHARDARRALN